MTIHHDYDLSQILWYKIALTAKYVLECSSKEDILEALAFVKTERLTKLFVCGLGSNVIFTDEYFDGAVIRIVGHHATSRFSLSSNPMHITHDGMIVAFAGEILGDIVAISLANNLIGLEWAGGLPGTVGAAVRGNVGAYGGEINDSLVSADVLDYSGYTPVMRVLSNQALQFAYRESVVKKHKKMLVVSATFQLKKGKPQEVITAKAVQEKNIASRQKNHPLEYPNCGSVFKNLRDKDQIEKVLAVYPELKESVDSKWYGKIAVASVIERLGLKGFRIGDAQVSEKHALFIVNRGEAKAKDVLAVIETIQKKFQETFGFHLELEVEVVH